MSTFRVPRLVAVVEVGDARWTSDARSMTYNPHWMQRGELVLSDEGGEGVARVSVWDKRREKMKCLGAALVPLSRLQNFTPTQMELHMEGGKRDGACVTVVFELRDHGRDVRRERTKAARQLRNDARRTASNEKTKTVAPAESFEKPARKRSDNQNQNPVPQPKDVQKPEITQKVTTLDTDAPPDTTKGNDVVPDTVPERTADAAEKEATIIVASISVKEPAIRSNPVPEIIETPPETKTPTSSGVYLHTVWPLVISDSPPPPPPSPLQPPRTETATSETRVETKNVNPRRRQMFAPAEVSFFGMTTPPVAKTLNPAPKPKAHSPSVSASPVSPSTPSPGAEGKTRVSSVYVATSTPVESTPDSKPETPKSVSNLSSTQTETAITETETDVVVDTIDTVEVLASRASVPPVIVMPIPINLTPVKVVRLETQEKFSPATEQNSEDTEPSSSTSPKTQPAPPPRPDTPTSAFGVFASFGAQQALSKNTRSPKRPPLTPRDGNKNTPVAPSVAPKRDRRRRDERKPFPERQSVDKSKTEVQERVHRATAFLDSNGTYGSHSVINPLDSAAVARQTLCAVVQVELDEIRRLAKTGLGSLRV